MCVWGWRWLRFDAGRHHQLSTHDVFIHISLNRTKTKQGRQEFTLQAQLIPRPVSTYQYRQPRCTILHTTAQLLSLVHLAFLAIPSGAHGDTIRVTQRVALDSSDGAAIIGIAEPEPKHGAFGRPHHDANEGAA